MNSVRSSLEKEALCTSKILYIHIPVFVDDAPGSNAKLIVDLELLSVDHTTYIIEYNATLSQMIYQTVLV